MQENDCIINNKGVKDKKMIEKLQLTKNSFQNTKMCYNKKGRIERKDN